VPWFGASADYLEGIEMSIFGSIRDAIFGGPAEAAPAPMTEAKPAEIRPNPVAGEVTGSLSAPKVDVAAMLDKLNKENPEDLDWRRSIVDLMKLLDLDSSLKARKELANELGYDGNMSDSAKMNIWLHKQVMTKLAEHGGIVPDELK
jgi:hypothetical protein